MTPPAAIGRLLPLLVIVVPFVWLGMIRLFGVLTGWLRLPRSASPLAAEESHRCCTVSLSRGTAFIDFSSCTVVRRLGSVIELRMFLLPSWLFPTVRFDAKTCTVTDDGRDLTQREPTTGVLIRPWGTAREVIDRAPAR